MNYLLFLLVLLFTAVSNGQKPRLSSIEFDTRDIQKLKLIIRWNQNTSVSLDRYLLTYETTGLEYDHLTGKYTTKTTTISDSILDTDYYLSFNFVHEKHTHEKSENDCAAKCFQSTTWSPSFDCNIYKYYTNAYRAQGTCQMYQYNYLNNAADYMRDDNVDMQTFENHDHFIELCDVHYLYCKEVPKYSNNVTFDIVPFIKYKFSLSVRNHKYEWSDNITREYTFSPNITIDVKGEQVFGKPLTLDCSVDLDPTVVTSIKWIGQQIGLHKKKLSLEIKELKLEHHDKNFTCEVSYGQLYEVKKIITKTFNVKLANIEGLKINLAIGSEVSLENMTVFLNLNTSKLNDITIADPERVLISYVDGLTTNIVKKYSPFQKSIYDQLFDDYTRTSVKNEHECRALCLKSDCDHYVFSKFGTDRFAPRNNCQYGLSNGNNRLRCGWAESCYDLLSVKKVFSNVNRLSIKLLPNKVFIFKIEMKFNGIGWISNQTAAVTIPAKLELIELGKKTSAKNEMIDYQLFCKFNVSREGYSEDIVFKRNGIRVSKYDPDYTIYANKSSYGFVHSILRFNLDSYVRNKFLGISEMNGNYSCHVDLESTDLDLTGSYESNRVSVEFTKIVETTFNKTSGNLILPILPGNSLELPCRLTASPIPKMEWRKGNTTVDEPATDATNFKLDSFVVKTIDETLTNAWLFLYVKLNKSQEMAQYQCVMNESVVMSTFNVTVIDHSPIIDVKLDTGALNNSLKVVFNINLTSNTPENRLFSEFNDKPIKYRIIYKRDNEFSLPNATFDVLKRKKPDTAFSLISILKDLIGYYQHTIANAESCRFVCIYNSLCKKYIYIPSKRSCILFTDDKSREFFANFTEKLKSTTSSSSKDAYTLTSMTSSHENIDLKNIDELREIDDKHSPDVCFDKHDTRTFLKTCYGELEEIQSPYTLDSLWPLTTYTFRIEAMNIFGKAVSTDQQVFVPFPLDDVKEMTDQENTKYSLLCETPLQVTENLNFKWFKNRVLINSNDEYEIKIRNRDGSEKQLFATELIFKQPNKNESGEYMCSLTFSVEGYTVNTSKVFKTHIKYGPVYNATVMYEERLVNDKLVEECEVSGWPVPSIDWYFNNHTKITPGHGPYHIIKSLSKSTTLVNVLHIHNLTEAASGVYMCKINGDKIVKNITLRVKSQLSPPTPSPHSSTKSKRNFLFKVIPFVVCLAIGAVLLVLIVLMIKRRQRNSSDTSSSLRYSNMNEETINIGNSRLELYNDSENLIMPLPLSSHTN